MMHGPPAMRSMMRDSSVTSVKIPPGTVRRMMGYARPYKKLIVIFLVLVVLDAIVAAVNPLILRAIINDGIGGNDSAVIVKLALLAALLALIDAGLSFAQTYASARIGEGVIYDLRARGVLARAAHADRVLQPHADRRARQPPQQRRDRRAAGVLGNVGIGGEQRHHGHDRDHHDAVPLVAHHHRRAVAGPAVRAARAHGRPQAAEDHAGALRAPGGDEHHHDRAVQRVGRAPRQAVRLTRARVEGVRGPRRTRARHRRHVGDVPACVLHLDGPARRAGHRARVRLGWRARGRGHAERRHGRRADRVPRGASTGR